jgi:hypothetical protein
MTIANIQVCLHILYNILNTLSICFKGLYINKFTGAGKTKPKLTGADLLKRIKGVT